MGSIDKLRKEILWNGNEPKASPDAHMVLTYEQYERLFSVLGAICDSIWYAEDKRRRKLYDAAMSQL
jgi:hypothetical protein